MSSRAFTDLEYKTGQFAPGLQVAGGQMNQIRHHGFSRTARVQAIRANGPRTKVGLAEDATVFVPVIEDAKISRRRGKATREENAPFLTAVLECTYT